MPDRQQLVGTMAARAVFVFLYGGFVEGAGRYLRPSHVYRFTDAQAARVSDAERHAWVATSLRPGRPTADQWYADTTREPIRDDLLRNQFRHLGVADQLSGVPTTSSAPTWFLRATFVALFDPALEGRPLDDAMDAWRVANLSAPTLARMKLKAHGALPKASDVYIDLPDGTRIRISAGPSSDIAKDLIEKFATRHLGEPALIWLSASDKKTHPTFVAAAAAVGLTFNPNEELPDVILVDLKDPPCFYFCEIVHSDGAITEKRKEAFISVAAKSKVTAEHLRFLTAFEDRGAAAFRKNFSRLAVDSLIWFRTEPDLLVVLTRENWQDLDPQS